MKLFYGFSKKLFSTHPAIGILMFGLLICAVAVPGTVLAAGGGSSKPEGVLPLDTFTVNLAEKGAFLKLGIELRFTGGQSPEGLDMAHYMAPLRSSIIYILSSKTAEKVLAAEGKEEIRAEVLEIVNELLGEGAVEDLYFTEFIVQ
jgi:flagellar basal body-associated protein FliL